MFTNDNFPCVGEGGVGCLYYRAPLIYLNELQSHIEQAENIVKSKSNKRTGKTYNVPSRARSEVGAIDLIEISPSHEKCAFTATEAINMLKNPKAVSGYHVELFETPNDPDITDDPLGQSALLSSLNDTFVGFGDGASVFLMPPIGKTTVLEFMLAKNSHPTFIENRIEVVNKEMDQNRYNLTPDYSEERHKRVLNALTNHPLVRSILPPVILELESTEKIVVNDSIIDLP